MATDWGPLGLNCNAIAPGYFDTPLNAALVADETFSACLANRTPQRRWGRVEELQGACVFLASDAASFVNGHTLFVDGGITACLSAGRRDDHGAGGTRRGGGDGRGHRLAPVADGHGAQGVRP